VSAEPISLPRPEPDPDRESNRGGTSPLGRDDLDLARVYVWQLPVRITHWLIVLSILTLSVTGLYIGHPIVLATGEARYHFVMGTMRVVHLYSAIVFTLAVLARIAWMFIGNRYARWTELLPVQRRRFKGLWPTFKFYVFAKLEPPAFMGHNPLAGATYVAVFGLYLLAILTGLGLYAPHSGLHSPVRIFAFLAHLPGGQQALRWEHHVVMWLLLGFMVHHIYSALLMSTVEKNGTMESIFSGYKFAPRRDLAGSGYRFRQARPAASPAPATSPAPAAPATPPGGAGPRADARPGA